MCVCSGCHCFFKARKLWFQIPHPARDFPCFAVSAWMLSRHSGFFPHAVSGVRFTGGSELSRKRQRKANAAATKTLTWTVLQTSSNRLLTGFNVHLWTINKKSS